MMKNIFFSFIGGKACNMKMQNDSLVNFIYIYEKKIVIMLFCDITIDGMGNTVIFMEN